MLKTAWYWYRDRHVDQWNRIEDPEMSPHIYGQLIFDKGAVNIQWKKVQPLQQMVLVQLALSMQKNENRPFLSPCTKLKCTWVKYLHIKPGILKLLDE